MNLINQKLLQKGINKEWIVAVEVKTTLKVEDVNEHIERLDRFRNFFPEYTDRKVIGAVAGMRIEEEADKYAYRRGFFVLAQSGENVIKKPVFSEKTGFWRNGDLK